MFAYRRFLSLIKKRTTPKVELENQEWVGCDVCSKWRRSWLSSGLPQHELLLQLLQCNMVETLMCETPEEHSDDESMPKHIRTTPAST